MKKTSCLLIFRRYSAVKTGSATAL